MKTRVYLVEGPGWEDEQAGLVRATSIAKVRQFLLTQYRIKAATVDELVEFLQDDGTLIDADKSLEGKPEETEEEDQE